MGKGNQIIVHPIASLPEGIIASDFKEQWNALLQEYITRKNPYICSVDPAFDELNFVFLRTHIKE